MAGNKELGGKVAIVTGAGRNIGRAIALALADGGASVVVNARSNRAEADAVAREIESSGGKALVHIGNVAIPLRCRRWRTPRRSTLAASISSSTMRRYGGKAFAEMSYADWREILTSPSTARLLHESPPSGLTQKRSGAMST